MKYFGLLFLFYTSTTFGEKWLPVVGTNVEYEGVKQTLYQDPSLNEQVLIMPSCIIAQRKREKIVYPSCHFQVYKGSVIFDEDSEIRGKKGFIYGVEWGSGKAEVSLFTSLFRRPKFSDESIEIYENNKWLKIKGLVPLN